MANYRSSVAQVLSLVDPKTGIIRNVQLFQNLADDPLAYCAVATPASVGPMLGFEFENNGAACALDEAGAAMRACGETIERYSSAFINLSQLTWATSEKLSREGKRVIDVDRFYSFKNEQSTDDAFSYRPTFPQMEKFWTEAMPVNGLTPVFVPASCVYLPYSFPKEYVTHAPISTGMAAGLCRDDCVEKGAAEIVERDALMVRWKCNMRSSGIDGASLAQYSPELARLSASTAHLPGRWWFSLLTLDIEIPIVSAAFINHNGLPLTSFGIASNACPFEATASAMREALLSRFLLNRTKLSPPQPGEPPASFRTLRDHLFGHAASLELRDVFLELFGGEAVLVANDLASRFDARRSVVNATLDAGLEVLSIDITSPDVRSAGIEVWRVLVPDAEPLDNDHACQHLGGSRLDRYRKQQGLSSFNPVPHPFP